MKSSFSSRQTGSELRLIIDRYSSMKKRLPSLHTENLRTLHNPTANHDEA